MIPAKCSHRVAPPDTQILGVRNGSARHAVTIIVLVPVIEVVQAVVDIEI